MQRILRDSLSMSSVWQSQKEAAFHWLHLNRVRTSPPVFAPIWKSPRSGSRIHGNLPVFSSQDGCEKVWRGIGVHEADFESMRLLEGSELCASNCRFVGSCICNNRVKSSIYISTRAYHCKPEWKSTATLNL